MFKKRTLEEIENLKQDLYKDNTIVNCIYSEEDICVPYCKRFKECWEYDYTKTIEGKLE